MNLKYSKILVCCPASYVSGGPELLHQLVHELRKIGHDAYIVYYPLYQAHKCPRSYQCYDTPQSQLIDEPNVLVVMPEVATWIGRHFKKAQGAVWWLSIDNYFGWHGESVLIDFLSHVKRIFQPLYFSRRKMPISALKRYVHFFQSEYAREFLSRRGVVGMMLTDYLGDMYLKDIHAVDYAAKQNVISFNPKKGRKRTNKLKRAYPEFKFVPIQGLSQEGVYKLLLYSKIYVDFGNHPGKDRLPREAVMAGCCVITGRRGSAKNDIDIPLPQRFKLDDRCDGYIAAFGPIVYSIFSDFPRFSCEMAIYREKIKQEKTVFQQQLQEIFGSFSSKHVHVNTFKR